jgi:radical SAM protein with 4Fe4S-binding SPASM domain
LINSGGQFFEVSILPRFKKIFLEITNRCNLACDFCCLAGSRPRFDMCLAGFPALLSQLKSHTGHLSLHVLGEPLLHPELPAILALCYRHGLRINLTTNGTLLPRYGGMLVASPALRQVNVSLHSVWGRKTKFDAARYLGAVLEFSRAAAGAGIYVSLRLWNLSGSGKEAGNDAVLRRLAEYFGLAEAPAPEPVAGQGVKLADKIFLSQKELFVWPALTGPDLGGNGCCPGLRDQAAILADGTVVPCCLDGCGVMNLGNVNERSFEEIVESERARRIREGFAKRMVVEPLCRRCSYRQRF